MSGHKQKADAERAKHDKQAQDRAWEGIKDGAFWGAISGAKLGAEGGFAAEGLGAIPGAILGGFLGGTMGAGGAVIKEGFKAAFEKQWYYEFTYLPTLDAASVACSAVAQTAPPGPPK